MSIIQNKTSHSVCFIVFFVNFAANKLQVLNYTIVLILTNIL